MIDTLNSKHSELIVYHFAYTNLIEYPELFIEPSTQIESFFMSFNNVEYISGIKQFEGKKASDYFIFRGDGHPNAKAHKLISEKVDEIIVQATHYNDSTNKNYNSPGF